MIYELNGKKVAILVMDGFEQVELVEPRQALIQAGAATYLVSTQYGEVKSSNENDVGTIYSVDVNLQYATADDFDALLLPGGATSIDALRTISEALDFVRRFFVAGKPMAAICLGPQMLIEADIVRGRVLTSCYSLRRDVANAGAVWKDEPVVADHGFVTGRCTEDIPLFNEKMIEEFAKGVHSVRQENEACH